MGGRVAQKELLRECKRIEKRVRQALSLEARHFKRRLEQVEQREFGTRG